jgi:hypothetical protein
MGHRRAIATLLSGGRKPKNTLKPQQAPHKQQLKWPAVGLRGEVFVVLVDWCGAVWCVVLCISVVWRLVSGVWWLVAGGVGVVRQIRRRRGCVDERGRRKMKTGPKSQNIQQKAVVLLVQLRESSLFVRGSSHWCLSNIRDLWLAVPEPGRAVRKPKRIRCG